jgi:hypothetical protein
MPPFPMPPTPYPPPQSLAEAVALPTLVLLRSAPGTFLCQLDSEDLSMPPFLTPPTPYPPVAEAVSLYNSPSPGRPGHLPLSD